MQTATRGLTIKQYQPTIQPISVTPATTGQLITTVVTGSNVKDDYESASLHHFSTKRRQHFSLAVSPIHNYRLIVLLEIRMVHRTVAKKTG